MSDAAFSIAELLADPDAGLERIRNHGPVVPMDMGLMVVEYEALRDALGDARLKPNFADFLTQLGVTSGPFFDWMSMSPLNMDGAEHRAWRQLMKKTFTPKSVEQTRPFVKSQSEELADALASLGHCDFVDAYARRLPSLGLCELIGVPPEDRDRFCGWADTIGLGFNLLMAAQEIDKIDDAITHLLDYAGQLVEKRLADPRDDFVTRLAQAASEEGVDAGLVRGSVAGLVFAGHETTKNQLGWMIAVLAEIPNEWNGVAKDPSRARDMIEELLRFRAAVTSLGRTAIEDLEIAGQPIPKGSRIIGSLATANRDRKAFPNPDEFDPEANKKNAQMAFGHGAHFCLGAALARLELQESLVALSARIECPKVEEGATWLPPIGINGPLTLPIRFAARSPA